MNSWILFSFVPYQRHASCILCSCKVQSWKRKNHCKSLFHYNGLLQKLSPTSKDTWNPSQEQVRANPASNNGSKSHSGGKPYWRCSLMCSIYQNKCPNFLRSCISWNSHLQNPTQFRVQNPLLLVEDNKITQNPVDVFTDRCYLPFAARLEHQCQH
jgi:hypothetical protein